MNPTDRAVYISRYTRRVREHGYSRRALGWSDADPELRFRILSEPVLSMRNASVLDVGCGFGDLNAYLRRQGWTGRYTGIDIVPALLEVARERDRGLDVRESDLCSLDPADGTYDFVISSGIFNAVLGSEDNHQHIAASLSHMFSLCTKALCSDFLSTHHPSQTRGVFYTDPAWALQVGLRLSRSVRLRHDYMPSDFAVFVQKGGGRAS